MFVKKEDIIGKMTSIIAEVKKKILKKGESGPGKHFLTQKIP